MLREREQLKSSGRMSQLRTSRPGNLAASQAEGSPGSQATGQVEGGDSEGE